MGNRRPFNRCRLFSFNYRNWSCLAIGGVPNSWVMRGSCDQKEANKGNENFTLCLSQDWSFPLGAPLPLNRVAWLVILYFRSHWIIKNDNHVTYVNRLASEPKYSSQIEFLVDFHACVKDFLYSAVYFLCVVSCDKLRTLWISCFGRRGTLFNSCVSGFGFVSSC